MAISPESYGRGRPVYDNGSFSPTKGTVDPSGYVDRSLNNPSDSRSGLAQAALGKLQQSSSGYTPMSVPGVLPIGDIKTLTITPTGQLIPDNEMQPSQEPPLVPPMSPPTATGLGGGLPSQQQGAATLSPMAQAALSRMLANGAPVNG